jgi:hypothetical protein
MDDCDCDDMVWRGLGDPCRCPPFGVAMRVVESCGGGVLTAFGAGTWLGWAPSVGGRKVRARNDDRYGAGGTVQGSSSTDLYMDDDCG